eukprot:12589568-Alexandrium_andersonii.AAC.1
MARGSPLRGFTAQGAPAQEQPIRRTYRTTGSELEPVREQTRARHAKLNQTCRGAKMASNEERRQVLGSTRL